MLVSNAKQILNVVTAAYPASLFGEDSPQDCQNPSSDIERLGCDWKLITAQLENRGEIKPSHTDPLFYDIFTVSQPTIASTSVLTVSTVVKTRPRYHGQYC